MTGFEVFIPGLATLAIETINETAKEESGSSLSKLLKMDVGKA